MPTATAHSDMDIPVAAALEAIQREGAFVLEDSNIGEQVLNFDKEIKTPDGFNFLARNSLDNPVSATYLQIVIAKSSSRKSSESLNPYLLNLTGHSSNFTATFFPPTTRSLSIRVAR
jgi:hypothetical protein